jgi:2-polyprenyl-3-methyl-5-hydroxy-6-metoxy-1,4-benzoquinol methylase
MAKTVQKKWFGIDCILRHDYEHPEIQKKLEDLQKKSVDAFTHFCTNIGQFKYGTVLDVGCGDDYAVNLLQEKFFDSIGIDLYVEENEYPAVVKSDWYAMAETVFFDRKFDAIFINHSLEHAENVYALMQQVSALQDKGGALFIAVPDGNSDFGCSITSSTTHFSCLTEKFLNTMAQRFGYQVVVERREFRAGAPELWLFGIKQVDGWDLSK